MGRHILKVLDKVPLFTGDLAIFNAMLTNGSYVAPYDIVGTEWLAPQSIRQIS